VTVREPAAPRVAVDARFGADTAVMVAAAVAALLCLIRVGLSAEGVLAAFVAFVLVRLAEIDVRHRILPNRIVLPATGALLVAHASIAPSRWPEWVLAAGGAAVVFLSPALLRPGALGMGDVKLAMLLGAALGRSVVPALLLGLFAAGLFAGALVLLRGRPALKTEMPLGPFLAFGGLAVLLA
jgi:leader peptidase (prepilin peptidase)/N-methyltransferase